MDTNAFISSLVGSLAWPASILMIVVLLRGPVGQLIPQLRKLKYGDLEADFGKEVEQVRQAAEKALPKSASDKAGQSGDPEALADVAPNAAVLAAWKEVEVAAKKLVAAHGHELDLDVANPFLALERVLDGTELVERSKVKIFHDLRQLRNRVAHAGEYEVTKQQAKEYARLGRALAQDFEGEAKKVPGPGEAASKSQE